MCIRDRIGGDRVPLRIHGELLFLHFREFLLREEGEREQEERSARRMEIFATFCDVLFFVAYFYVGHAPLSAAGGCSVAAFCRSRLGRPGNAHPACAQLIAKI